MLSRIRDSRSSSESRKRLFFFEQIPQSDQEYDRTFQPGAGVERSHTHIVARVRIFCVQRSALSKSVVDGLDERLDPFAIGMQDQQVLAREIPFVTNSTTSLATRAISSCGLVRRDDLRKSTVWHGQQVGHEDVVIFLIFQAQADTAGWRTA